MKHLHYRPDIDGLRAIAVVSVIVYHIFPTSISGGFTGVDIFFVISGFLITGIIFQSAAKDDFSFAEFYRRRILRIVPALTAVLLVSLLLGHFVMLPGDFVELTNTSIASQLSVANIYYAFNLDTSYFAQDSSLQPLLHIWSLGIEEQFYFIWPLLLLMVLKARSTLVLFIVTGCIVVASTLWAEHILHTEPMAAYYLLPSRAGELALGALAYFTVVYIKAIQSIAFANITALFGFISLSVGFATINEAEGFPGLVSLIPTIGTFLILVAGAHQKHVLSSLLANKFMVTIGLWSYSLYLWHWPILAFYRYLFGIELSLIEGGMLFVVTLLCGYLSYQFVEKAYRSRYQSFKVALVRVLILPTAVIGLVASGVYWSDGFGLYGKSYKTDLSQLGDINRAAYEYSYVCQAPRIDHADVTSNDCIINGDLEPRILLWGDSHAAHYTGVIASIAAKENFSFRNIAHSSCAPLLFDIEENSKPKKKKDCLHSVPLVHEYLDQYDTILLGGSWRAYFGMNESFIGSLEKTVVTLVENGKNVIILGQVPRLPSVDRGCVLKSLKVPFVDCHSQSSEKDLGDYDSNIALKKLASNHDGVEYFDVRDNLCVEGRCSGYKGADFLYYDEKHLSMDGSWIIGEEVIETRGTPAVFKSLRDKGGLFTSHKGNLRDWLDHRAKFAMMPVIKNGQELGAVFKSNKLFGNAVIKLSSTNNTLIVNDDSDSSFQFTAVRIPYRGSLGRELQLKIEVEVFDSHFPMFRVITKSNSGNKTYDVVLNPSMVLLRAKNELSKNQIYLEKASDNRFLVFIRLDIFDSLVEDPVLMLYPAASTVFPRYEKKAVGTIKLHNLEYVYVGGS